MRSATTRLTIPTSATPLSKSGLPFANNAGQNLYISDEYLKLTHGTWHAEDSAFKARYIDHLRRRNKCLPATTCEIGCGVGGILAQLQKTWPGDCKFVGYEISPQAHALSRELENCRLQFRLGDAFENNDTYDLVLVMDVVEHVEDCFEFLRKVRMKGQLKMYHFPLDITCTSALRDIFGRSYSLGHIHHFSHSSALEALRYTGHRVIDSCLTPVGFECAKRVRTRIMNMARYLLPKQFAARTVGGFSLMVLCE